MSTIIDIVSVGKACSILQVHPASIRKATEELALEPTARINGIDHYDAHQLAAIASYLRCDHRTDVKDKE